MTISVAMTTREQIRRMLRDAFLAAQAAQELGPVHSPAALAGLLLSRGRRLGRAAGQAAEQGREPSAAAQQQGQEQHDQFHPAAPAAGTPGAAPLGRPVLIASGVPHRACAQALATLAHAFAGAGHVFLPASGSVVVHDCIHPFLQR